MVIKTLLHRLRVRENPNNLSFSCSLIADCLPVVYVVNYKILLGGYYSKNTEKYTKNTILSNNLVYLCYYQSKLVALNQLYLQVIITQQYTIINHIIFNW